MNPHNLPPLRPLDQKPAPGTTSTNPGVINPADQCYPAVKPEDDQTQTVGRISSASTINSNGETQRLNLETPVLAKTLCEGLPLDVFAGMVSHSKPILPTVAVTTPPSSDVAADNNRPGGLAANVNIR